MEQHLALGRGIEIALLSQEVMVDDHQGGVADLARELAELVRHDQHERCDGKRDDDDEEIGRQDAQRAPGPEVAEGEAAARQAL
jgi:hypothetical protein